MADLEYIQKNGRNSHFNYSFVQEADVKAAVSKALRAHGFYISNIDYVPMGECTGKAAALRCELTLKDIHSDERVYFQGIGAGTDSSDKAPMKACAASLKYALTSGFLIATGDDPEEDGGTAGKAQGKTGKPANTNDTPDPDAVNVLTLAINTAAGLADLNKLKPKIAALRGTDGYDKLADAFKAKGKALSEAA
jgi:hypothetical protein